MSYYSLLNGTRNSANQSYDGQNVSPPARFLQKCFLNLRQQGTAPSQQEGETEEERIANMFRQTTEHWQKEQEKMAT
jgi:hypothetical protein